MWLDVGAIVFWVGLIGWLIYSHFPKKSSEEYSGDGSLGMIFGASYHDGMMGDCYGVGCPEEIRRRRRRRRSLMY